MRTRCYVQGYDGVRRRLQEWITVELSYQHRALPAQVLVMDDVEGSFLLSRPQMKAMQMNLFWDDRVDVEGGVYTARTLDQPFRRPKSADEVMAMYPELKRAGACPSSVNGHAVANAAAIRR